MGSQSQETCIRTENQTLSLMRFHCLKACFTVTILFEVNIGEQNKYWKDRSLSSLHSCTVLLIKRS